jgi:Na+/H+ antiporter NhaA
MAESSGRSIGRPRLAALRGFIATESGGAVVLLVATLTALVWANSAWAASYTALWALDLSIELGPIGLSQDLGHWVNDGLMTLFFLLIGLEIRREFDMGDLRERRRVAVPVIAGIGGMAIPVLLFLALNSDPEASRGWAMVMATDTAFALGVLALAGRHAPLRLRVFLLTLMVVDDVGAIGVIAIVYSTDVVPVALVVAAGLLVGMVLLRRAGVQRAGVYWAVGIALWLATMQAGIHPTVAGVAIGLLTSAYAPRSDALQHATGVTRAFREQPSPELARAATRSITFSLSPNVRLQHTLHPWTSFAIVPLFALANAGIELSPTAIGAALGSSITWGVIVGLVVGKVLGITLGAWIATRRWAGGLPVAVGWPSIIKISSVAGIGFTVSLLIAQLSYSGPLLQEAKLGILAASIIAATLSIGLFHVAAFLPSDWRRRAEAGTAPELVDLMMPVDPAVDHVRGPADADISIVQYGDYECPYCRAAAPVVSELLTRFAPRLSFVARHLPLPDVHPNAALAAEAAEAAAAQGRFWEMHATLYEHQDALQLSDLVRYARELGLDEVQFESDLRAGRFSRRVARDVASAEAAGVAGTPTFFINEVRYVGRYDLSSLERAVRAALSGVELRATPAPASAD